MCEEVLINRLDTCNVARLWLCGYFYNAEDLEFFSTAFMAKQWALLVKDEEVQAIYKEHSNLAIMISKPLSSDETGSSTTSPN